MLLLNQVRGLTTSLGIRVPKCSPKVFPRRVWETISEDLFPGLAAQLVIVAPIRRSSATHTASDAAGRSGPPDAPRPPLDPLNASALSAPSPAMAPSAPLAPIDRFADECPTDNHFFATMRFNRPETRTGGTGDLGDAPALISFRYTESVKEHYVLARHRDIGSEYGITFALAEPAVYVADVPSSPPARSNC